MTNGDGLVVHIALFGESHFLEANKALVPYKVGGNGSQQQKAGAHGLADTQGMEGEAEQKGRARSQEPGRILKGCVAMCLAFREAGIWLWKLFLHSSEVRGEAPQVGDN